MVNRHSALSREIAMSPDISNDDKAFVTLTALLLTQGIVYHTQSSKQTDISTDGRLPLGLSSAHAG